MTFKRNMEEQIDFKIITLSVNSREFDFSDFKDLPIKQNSFMKKILESYSSDFNEDELHSIEELFRLTTIYYQKTYSTFNFDAIECSVFEDFVRSNSKFLELSANIKKYDIFLAETKPFFSEGTDNAVVEFVFKNMDLFLNM